MKSYSQNDEDVVVREYFDLNYGAEFKGFFIDLGANDGITFSNTYSLLERGWSGCLVDASRTAFTQLVKNTAKFGSKASKWYTAVGDKDGRVTFYESNDGALVSSTIASETKKWAESGVKFKAGDVPMVTVQSLIEQMKVEEVDFFSIDIEGNDLSVMKDIPFTRLNTKCVCVEWNGKQKDAFSGIANSHGMGLIHETPENLIFAK